MLRTASLCPPQRKWLATAPAGAEYRMIAEWNRCDMGLEKSHGRLAEEVRWASVDQPARWSRRVTSRPSPSAEDLLGRPNKGVSAVTVTI
jgi:hypothetical protein